MWYMLAIAVALWLGTAWFMGRLRRDIPDDEGHERIGFWNAVAVLGVAKLASRMLKHLPFDIPPLLRVEVGFVVYSMVIALLLTLWLKLSWKRGLIISLIAAAVVYGGSVAMLVLAPGSWVQRAKPAAESPAATE